MHPAHLWAHLPMSLVLTAPTAAGIDAQPVLWICMPSVASALHTAQWLHRTLCPTPVQAAAAAETQTELAARVSTWRQKIQPMLDEQEAQPAFDIHTYGDSMLEELATVSAVDPEDPVQLQEGQVGFEMSELLQEGLVDAELAGPSMQPSCRHARWGTAGATVHTMQMQRGQVGWTQRLLSLQVAACVCRDAD